MNKFTKYRLAGELETTISGKLLYLMLLDTADAKGKIAFSGRCVSEALGISQATVRRNFRRLQNGGYIDIVPRYHADGGCAANQLVILD